MWCAYLFSYIYLQYIKPVADPGLFPRGGGGGGGGGAMPGQPWKSLSAGDSDTFFSGIRKQQQQQQQKEEEEKRSERCLGRDSDTFFFFYILG